MGIESFSNIFLYKISQKWNFVYDDNGFISEIHGISKLYNSLGEIDSEAEGNATLSYDMHNNVIHVSYENKKLKGRESEDTEDLNGSFTCFLKDGRIVKEEGTSSIIIIGDLIYDENGRAINLPWESGELFIMERDNNGFLNTSNDKNGYYSFTYCHDDVTESSKRLVGLPTLIFYNTGLIMPVEMICELALQYQGFYSESEPQLLSTINYSENGLSYENLFEFEYEIENKMVVSMICNKEEEDDDGRPIKSSIHYNILWDSESSITHVNNDLHGKILYYDLNGRNIGTPQKGLYIVKMPNGQIKKTLIK